MITCREAKLEDLNDILYLLNQLSSFSEEDKKISQENLSQVMQKIIENGNHYLIIAEKDNEIIGTSLLLIQLNLFHGGKSSGHIENVITDKNYRNRGVGKEMIKFLIEKAKEKNCYKVILNCKKENIPFYEKCNLKETGEVEMRISL